MLGALSSASKRGLLAMSVVLVMAASLIWVAPVAMGGPNPPGNNGTVKLDRLEFDTHPNNQPHVGCTFQVDFYGFDEGDLDADVTFEVHPPTGKPVVILTDVVDIGEDDNSGGGSEAGLDAQVTYTLDLSAYAPHPQQGWHVKLTVNAEGSQGADTKHKVFWVSGCATPPTTTAPTTTTSAPPTTTTSAPPTTTSEATTTSMATTTSIDTSSTTSQP